MAPKPSQDTLIHCEACGEDYSSTYRSCPFCGARNNPRRASGRADPKTTSRYIPTPPPARDRQDSHDTLDDTYTFDGQDAFDEEAEGDEDYYTPRPKGGKRLAPREDGGFELPPVNWPRLITFLCSLVIIVAFLIITFTFIYPRLHSNRDNPTASTIPSSVPSAAPSLPVSAEPSLPVASLEPSPEPSVAPTGSPATVINASIGLRVRSGPGISYEVIGSLNNGSPITVLEPADNGWYSISFVNNSGAVQNGYIMGDYISNIAGTAATTPAPVNSSAPSTPAPSTPAPSTPAPAASTPPSSSSGGNVTVGRTGKVVNADGGLRVRSGPGTSNSAIATVYNGTEIQVVADAGNGWYQITFSGQGGVSTPGYLMGEYISTN